MTVSCGFAALLPMNHHTAPARSGQPTCPERRGMLSAAPESGAKRPSCKKDARGLGGGLPSRERRQCLGKTGTNSPIVFSVLRSGTTIRSPSEELAHDWLHAGN